MRRSVSATILGWAALQAAAGEPALHMFVLDRDAVPSQIDAQADTEIPTLHMTILPKATEPRASRPPAAPFRFTYGLGAGYRRDELDWKTSSGGRPFIRETWRDLDNIRLTGEVHIVTPIRLTFQGRIAYSWVLAGRQRRSDYLGDRYDREFSRIAGDADQGHGLMAAAGFGYRLPLWDQGFRAWLEPLAGYGYRELNLDLQNPRQTVATPGLTPPAGRLRGAEHRYQARWHGPWLGMRLGLAGERWELHGQGEYHFARYQAGGRWKRLANADRKIAFEQEGDGFGLVAGVGGSYRFWDRLAIQLDLDFQHWKIDGGADKTVLEDGSQIRDRLDAASWRSLGGNLSVRYDF